MPDYKVIVEGTTLAGFDRAAVVQKLALLTKQSEETANRLLSGQPTIVKARVDQPTALHYQNAFRTIGAAARIEELEVLIIDIPDAPLSPADAAPPGVWQHRFHQRFKTKAHEPTHALRQVRPVRDSGVRFNRKGTHRGAPP